MCRTLRETRRPDTCPEAACPPEQFFQEVREEVGMECTGVCTHLSMCWGPGGLGTGLRLTSMCKEQIGREGMEHQEKGDKFGVVPSQSLN